MPRGRVKFFNTDRGYGFIAPDGGGSDVFVHVHDVEAAGMKVLEAGQLVAYDVGPRGMAAQRPSIFACSSIRDASPPALRECRHRGLAPDLMSKPTIAGAPSLHRNGLEQVVPERHDEHNDGQ
jgi:cold shock protein